MIVDDVVTVTIAPFARVLIVDWSDTLGVVCTVRLPSLMHPPLLLIHHQHALYSQSAHPYCTVVRWLLFE